MRRLLPIVIAAGFLSIASPALGARSVPHGFFGVMTDGVLLERPDVALDQQFSAMAGNGVETVRPVVYWSDAQPSPDGVLQWTGTDRIFAAAARRSISVLPVVLRAPAWARIDEADFASPPADPATFAAFCRLLVARYGPDGSFWAANPDLPVRPQRRWEVWNEPNLDRYWSSPQPFQSGFVSLMRAAHDAFKQADPGSKVVLAAMGNDSWRALRRAYEAGLRGSMFDEVALHPFSGRLANVLKIVELNRDELRRHGDIAKPLVISEITWPSSKGKTTNTTGFETSEVGQAMRLTNAFRAFSARRRTWKLQAVIWSTWLTPDRDSSNSFDWSGLRRTTEDGTIIDKPALGAFRSIALAAEGRAGR